MNLMRIQVTDYRVKILLQGYCNKISLGHEEIRFARNLVFAVRSLNFVKKLETSSAESEEDTGYRLLFKDTLAGILQ